VDTPHCSFEGVLWLAGLEDAQAVMYPWSNSSSGLAHRGDTDHSASMAVLLTSSRSGFGEV